LLLNLDAETKGIEPRIYVYFVKNGAALNLANLLKQVFADALTADEIKKPQRVSPLPQKPNFGEMLVRQPVQTPGLRIQQPETSPPPPAEPPRGVLPPAEEAGDIAAERGSLRGPIKITPDEIRNALVIEAAPADYRVIRNVLKKIDVLPRQVLIEATIAEIDYSIITDLGVKWEFLKGADYRTLHQAQPGLHLRSALPTSLELRSTPWNGKIKPKYYPLPMFWPRTIRKPALIFHRKSRPYQPKRSYPPAAARSQRPLSNIGIRACCLPLRRISTNAGW
jgi:type II secretory pathway component GspD/PulD (secretin)